MTPREGHTCPICGYPKAAPTDRLCEQCEQWQHIGKVAPAPQPKPERTAA